MSKLLSSSQQVMSLAEEPEILWRVRAALGKRNDDRVALSALSHIQGECNVPHHASKPLARLSQEYAEGTSALALPCVVGFAKVGPRAFGKLSPFCESHLES